MKKRILIWRVMALAGFLLCVAGCAHNKQRMRTAEEFWRAQSNDVLMKKLVVYSKYAPCKATPSNVACKHAIDYYTVHELLQQRRSDSGVFDSFVRLLKRTRSAAVARDMVRTLEMYYDDGIDMTAQFMELFKDPHVCRAGKDEILVLFQERQIKKPELVWILMDPARAQNDIEKQYLNYVQQ
jgi:hypothetical protein